MKNEKWNLGEYEIRPYKAFPAEGRGEPCAHPIFCNCCHKRSAGYLHLIPH